MELIEKKYKKALSGEETNFLDFSLERFKLREDFRTKTSWHVPSQSLLNEMKKYEPLVSVGSGHAYTEALAKRQSVDIIATDIQPNNNNNWCKGSIYYTAIEKITARKAVLKYFDRNVFMAWPPYNYPMATQVAKAMKPGRYLIYVGEPIGGCTGDDNFFHLLNKDFKKIDTKAKVDKWFGIHDYVCVYQKK